MAMLVDRGWAFELGPLGSHVAVQDGRPLALPAHCTAGDDCRDRGQQGREQEPARARRVFQLGWPGASRGRWLVGHSFFSAALVLKVCFTRVLMVQFLRRPARVSALVLEFADPILLGANGRRAGGILQLACNGDSTNLAGVCGERPDWPVSDQCTSFDRSVEAAPLWRRGEGALREPLGTHGLSVWREACPIFLTKEIV